MKLITALILSVSAITAHAYGYSDVFVQHTSIATKLLKQCPKGGCTLDEIDIIREACAHLRVARSAAASSGDTQIYQTARQNVKNVCGPD